MRIIEIANILKDHQNLKRKFEGLLPELIRKLIDDMNLDVTYNRFPSRDAISTPGVDGIVKNNTECEFIPLGESIWEIGTSGLKKINDDYNKREIDIKESIRKDITFILIFPKYWSFDTLLIDWRNERKNQWKDVLVYDAEILNKWLERCPNIALWFLKELGITQNYLNFNLIDQAYQDLINCTIPKLSQQIFCEEREKEKIQLIDAIKTEQNTIYVKSESQFESLGFILSTVLENTSDINLDDCLVINDRDTYIYLNNILNNKILILNFGNIHDLKIDHNKIIIPCYKNNFLGGAIELNVRGQRTMSKLLSDMGLNSQESTDINYKSNGNLLIIRRLLAKDIVDKEPKWAKSQDIFYIFPLLLLQNFDVTNESHIRIAEYVTGINRQVFFQKLSLFQENEDCPFRIVGNIYQLYNLEESWFVLKKFMVTVFDKITNILKLFYYNKQPNENKALTIDGLSNSNLDSILKILAFYAIDSDENQYLVDSVVSSLLDLDKSNNYLISKNLHILAECSPDKICSFLEDQSNNKSSYFLELLQSNEYYKILSALDYLLTLNNFKFRALNILIKISQFDIKYSYSNTPMTELKEALIPYFNKNALSINDKLNFIKLNLNKYDQMAKLYIDIISSTSCFITINFYVRKPQFANTPTSVELKEFRKELDKIVLDYILMSNNFQLICKIIEYYYLFPPKILNDIADYFKSNKTNFNDNDLYLVYRSSIDKLAVLHKFQHHDNWLDRKNYMEPFTILIQESKPKDIFMQYKYMFEDYSDYIDIETDEELDYGELENRKNNIRAESLKFLSSTIGEENTIIKYINNVSDEFFWGKFLVDLFYEKLDLIFDICIKEKKLNILSGVMGFTSNKSDSINIFNKKVDFSLKERLLPLLYDEQYESICNSDEELKIFYSKKSFGIHTNFDDKRFNKYLKYNPIGTLDYFYNRIIDDNLFDLAIKALNAINLNKTKFNKHQIWQIEELFTKLENYKYSEELALLELDFIDVFERYYPNALINYWFKNPYEFIEYYKGISEGSNKYSYVSNLQFNLRFRQEHYLDEVGFNCFCNALLDENISLLTEILGNIIGKSCQGEDGIFPHESARLILEKNNEYLNAGFLSGYINSLGGRFVETGKIEFEKAKNFENDSKKLALKYPVTSMLLLKISKFHNRTGIEDRSYDLLGF